MKKLSILSLFALLLVGAVSSNRVPTVRASFWVDELGNCSSAYVSTANLWKEYLDENEITQAQYDADMDELQGLYTGCLGVVSVPSHEPDFCYAAHLANQDCIFQGQNLIEPDPGFYMECRAKTGIDLCQ